MGGETISSRLLASALCATGVRIHCCGEIRYAMGPQCNTLDGREVLRRLVIP